MAPEVLVMCERCGRPQKAAKECVHCGTALPTTPIGAGAQASGEAKGKGKAGREKLLDAYDPFLECDLGAGRKLLLSERRLEWQGADAAHGQVELAALASAS